jgi:ATP-dependent Clp protease adaptor protein ClpS
MSAYADIEEVEVLEDVDLEEELSDIGTGNVAYLIVYNDDVNSFDWVIESFVDVLKHAADQAEQLAMIIHYKGKATVKTAAYAVLKPKKDALCDRGLSAIIEGGDEDA